MHRVAEERLPEIEQLCREHRVRRLDLFGSATGGEFRPDASDLDFLVAFEPPPEGAYRKTYCGLLNGLRELFDRPVDLVDASAVRNPYFREAVEQTREQLYAA